jgi:hypothetical protein
MHNQSQQDKLPISYRAHPEHEREGENDLDEKRQQNGLE